MFMVTTPVATPVTTPVATPLALQGLRRLRDESRVHQEYQP